MLAPNPERYPKLLIDTYEAAVVEEIDMKQVREILGLLTFENAKVVISGKDVLHNQAFDNPLSDMQKETYMKTKFRVYEKPVLPEIVDSLNFHIPKKNPLIPENFGIFSQIKLK